MKNKKIMTIAILVLALGVASYVIYDEWRQSQIAASNQERLEEYLENDPTEPREFPGISEGDMAIDIPLADNDTEEMKRISDHRGEFLVMNLWASWCPPCQDEMPHINQFYEDYKDEDLQVIGVNLTTQEANVDEIYQFIEDFQIPFPVLFDLEGELHDAYEVITIPMTYILDPEGRISVRHIGYLDYDILESLYHDAKESWDNNL